MRKHSKRRAIAYIAGRIVNNIQSALIYDHLEDGHFNFSGDVSSNINVYDYSRSNYLIGDSSLIYDYYTGQYIKLQISGNSFSGYNYETGSYFNGAVNGYQLPTLRETEKHIKEKGYLQGIPSAAEVKTNGIDMGKMNAKLLQKIEELTLHLIEQNKKIDFVKKENDLQKEDIKYLKTKLE